MSRPLPLRMSGLTLLLLSVALEASPQPRFQTLDLVTWVGTNGWPLRSEQASECREEGEELPYEQDVRGNWGHSAEGFQMSIRFPKAVFTHGERIVASMLLRNVSSTNREHVISRPEKLDFNIVRDNAFPVRRKDDFSDGKQPIVQGARQWTLVPGAQRKYKTILSESFDLSAPGKYYVSTTRRIRRLDGTGYGQVMSGTAIFEIVAAPGTSAGTNAPGAVRTPVTGNTGQASPPPLASPPATATNVTSQADATGGHATQGASSVGGRSPMATNGAPQEAAATPARRNLVLSAWLAGVVLLGALGLWLLRRRKA